MNPMRTLGVLNREGMRAFNSGRGDDAMFQLVQADRLAKAMKWPLHRAKIRNNIGLVYQVNGQYKEAFESFRLAEKKAVEGAGSGNCLHRVIQRNMARLESVMVGGAV